MARYPGNTVSEANWLEGGIFQATVQIDIAKRKLAEQEAELIAMKAKLAELKAQETTE